MISYELEELAERLRGKSEEELLHDEELQGLSSWDYMDFIDHLSETSTPPPQLTVGTRARVRAACVRRVMNGGRA